MTRQEAVEVIKDFVAYGKHVNAFVYKGSTAIPIEALNMAIAALDQEETLKNLKKPNKSDLISRQVAIDALAKEMPSLTTPDGCGEFDHDIQITDEAFVDCMQIINGLPSTQPERKKGKWIIDNKEAGRIWHCHCSNCGKDPQDHIGGTENWWLVRLPKYCPNCGLPMRGDEE